MNIKQLFILLIIIAFAGCEKNNISSTQSEYFIKFYGDVFADVGYDVKQTSDGGYIVVGTSFSEETGQDIVIFKTDKYGNKKWQTENIGDTLNDIGHSIIEKDNSYYFVGTNAQTTSNADIIIGNLDNSGNLNWKRNIGGAGIQEGNNFIIDSNNDLVIVGATNITTAGDTLATGIKNILILKTNSAGDSLASLTFEGFNTNLYDDYGKDIIEKADGNYVMIGNTRSNGTNKSIYKSIIVELTSSLFPVRPLVPNPNQSLETKAHALLITQDQEMFFIGSQKNETGTHTDIYIAKISASLSGLEWTKTFGGNENDIGYGLVETENNLAFIATSASFGNGNNDIYFEKTDKEGNSLETYQIIGGSGNEEARKISATDDNGFIIVGMNSFDDNADIALIKTDNLGLLK